MSARGRPRVRRSHAPTDNSRAHGVTARAASTTMGVRTALCMFVVDRKTSYVTIVKAMTGDTGQQPDRHRQR
jgi:hypothetical protein